MRRCFKCRYVIWSTTFTLNLKIKLLFLLSRFPNHCNGAEGIHVFGDLCKYWHIRQAKGGNGASTGTHPTLETNKQTVCAYDHPAMSNKSYRFLTLSATQCSASQLKLYNFCMETDSYFTYSMPAQLWRRGRIALAQNNQAKFCVFRCNQEDSSRSSFFMLHFFTMRSMSNLDFFL